MTRSELAERLAKEQGITYAIAEEVVRTIFGQMTETLIDGGRIEIRGFGSLEAREYDGRNGRNPKTGQVVQVKPKRSPFFKTGKELKERIMGVNGKA